ncbi:MAG: hypothetical protein ABI821_05225 [Pseudomonadota bacterium]
MKKIHITRLATVAGVTGAIAVAALAFASGEKSAPQTVAAAPHFNTQFVGAPAKLVEIGDQSMQTTVLAFVDAETKQLRPATQAELNDSAAKAAAAAPKVAARSSSFAAAPAAAAPASVQLANGSTMVVLDESYLSYAVATIGPDGKVKQACIEKQPNAEAALRTAVAMKGAVSNEK